ncbi:23S rRNA (uracil(1939)-C(5))-methyltransferase RlmD [Anaerocolumna sp. AGMB13025]|uniref:23S rRNA (uracil(1939)-C(5))-methyltransferase RlmD n=1 Tax=Anaerocolumna sp. AGMB13025 TaxID=3039116 RepID=UPI00241C15B7|nr:23S rRNA (uracil(1939)-C(5))-methyltransferase RlmD [Anaerocolumna sp. AGMB13025]WFR55874.1 23S rRNA (uracil(1939)-C(5))-methyltransferase RlmD [Anaerocolumna sp. AGMB13025]
MPVNRKINGDKKMPKERKAGSRIMGSKNGSDNIERLVNYSENSNRNESKNRSEIKNRSENKNRPDSKNRSENKNRPDSKNRSDSKNRLDSKYRLESKSRPESKNRSDSRNIAESSSRVESKNKSEMNNKYEENNRQQGKNRAEKYNKSNQRGKISGKNNDMNNNDTKNNKKSLCPVLYKCGGCQILDLSYEQQLKTKQKQVEGLLGKFAKVETIIGMENPYHYRNKVHAVFDHDKKGNPISGVYEAGTHRVVPVESCMIEDQQADAIIGTIRGMLKSFKIKTYDEDTDFGLLRHVLIRKGFHSGQIMVVLVLSSPILPSKSNFIKALLKKHPEITTIVLNVNDKRTSMVLGEKEQVIYGKGYIEDTLCGKVFRISPKSFYQVNTIQTEILYGKAIELADLTGKETIVDAYCGIGTIGLIASEHVKKVIGVELNSDAVRDAKTNAGRNKITNVDFYNKDAGEFMSQMAAQDQSVEVVFMDPPRAGSDEKFLNSLCTLAPGKIVYISCNPETLERDMGYLVKNRYKVERIIPVDMFPGTSHVETVVLLHKKDM